MQLYRFLPYRVLSSAGRGPRLAPQLVPQRALSPLLWLVLSLALWLGWAQAASAVGFQHGSVGDPTGPAIEIGVWYPSAAPAQATRLELFQQEVAPDGPLLGEGEVLPASSGATRVGALLPLVVISHGAGGSYAGHYDTAIALANAGFIVVSLTHTGDNYRDQSRALAIWDRPRQVSVVLDYMEKTWPDHARIDPQRIGVFGFSAGGFTALALVGGVPDFAKVDGHCTDHPDEWTCHYIATSKAAPLPFPKAAPNLADARIKAAVIAAPALGYTFVPNGLERVTVPIQLWRANDDRILPQPYYAQAVRDALPQAPEYHEVPDAGHFDFLVPCSPALAAVAQPICSDPPSFDRAQFHEKFNTAVVEFLSKHLLVAR